jgi:hypothetical protein
MRPSSVGRSGSTPNRVRSTGGQRSATPSRVRANAGSDSTTPGRSGARPSGDGFTPGRLRAGANGPRDGNDTPERRFLKKGASLVRQPYQLARQTRSRPDHFSSLNQFFTQYLAFLPQSPSFMVRERACPLLRLADDLVRNVVSFVAAASDLAVATP